MTVFERERLNKGRVGQNARRHALIRPESVELEGNSQSLGRRAKRYNNMAVLFFTVVDMFITLTPRHMMCYEIQSNGEKVENGVHSR